MKALAQNPAVRLQRLPPLTSLVIGFIFLAVVSLADLTSPFLLSFMPFYALGVAFLGWSAGFWSATIFSLIATLVTGYQDWRLAQAEPEHLWIVFLNCACRLAAFVVVGWVTAKLASLTRHLSNLVEERTTQLNKETDQHKATSARLAEANERFLQVINNITEVFWLTDLPGFRVIYTSPGYERIWGRLVEDLYRDSRAWLEAICPEDREEVARRVVNDQPTGRYDVEYRINRPDGSVRWIRDRGFPVRDARGDVIRIAGIAQDITDQKRTEQLLKTQAAILENMAEAALMVDDHGIITLTNPAANALLGYAAGELAGMPLHLVARMTLEEYQRAFQTDFQDAQAGASIVREYQARRKDGGLVLAEVRISGFTINSRYFLVLVGQDITDRKRAQQALARQEELYRSLFELCPDGILLEDTHGTILDVNKAICQVLGYSRSELLGQNVRVFAAPEASALVDEHLAALRSGRALEHEVWNVRKDGGRRLMRLSEKPISLPDGRHGIMVVASDITERKRDELAREALLALGTKLRIARTQREAAQAMFDSADQLWEWHSATFDIYLPEFDRMEHVVNYDVVDGQRCEVPEVRPSLPPTPRMRRIMQSGPELILRGQPGASLPNSVKFGDTSRASAAIMCVPLRREGRHVGVLSIQSYTPDAFDHDDLRHLQALADHCGSALDRMRAEAGLRESEERYRTLAESSPDAIFILDSDLQVQYVNSSAAALWGRQPKDLVGRKQEELFPPETARRQSEVVAEILRTGETVHRDVEVPYPGGRRWQETRLAPMRDSQGEITSVMGVSRDITDRKHAEEELRRSEERYRTVVEDQTEIISRFKPDGAFAFVNEAFCRFFGKMKQDFVGQKWQPWADPAHLARIEAELRKLSPSQPAVVIENRVISKAGQRHWMQFANRGLFDDQGHLLEIQSVGRDITEQKRAEFLLRAQRDLATALSSTSDLKTAAERLLEIALQTEGLDAGRIFLFDPARSLDLMAEQGFTATETAGRERAKAEESAIIEKGRPLYLDHANLHEGRDGFSVGADVRSLALAPLSHAGVSLGAIKLFSRTEDQICSQARIAIETLAAEAASAIARIRAEEALHQSEARLRAFITSAPVLLFAGDQEGRITLEDGLALKVLGVEPGARVGQSVFDVFAHAPALLDNVRRVLRGEEFNTLIELESCAFDCWYSPVHDKNGNVTGFNGVATNVTERHRLERQIVEISDREQARIGQDIHDGLCQQLVTMAFDANSLQADLARDGHPEAQRAARIAGFLDEAITEARHLARGLFPVRLESEGLSPALQELANTTRRRFRVECRFRSRGAVEVQNHAVATHLYRIAQEAVNNSIHHGKSHTIMISLRRRADELELLVSDDGTGFSRENPDPARGMGLHIMDYRARAVGGTLRFSAPPEGGVMVSCCIPRPQSQ